MTDKPHITVYRDLEQGSPEWLEARCGLLTASQMNLILTPTLKAASNDKERAHLYELTAQRISQYVEPSYQSFDMERGQAEEIEARRYYAHHFAPVEEVGFIVNRRWGFAIGCSPDGLVGEDGGIEIKSRRAAYQVRTILENVHDANSETIPAEFVLQVQTSLLVTERAWWDFISFSGGLPMAVIRVWPDPVIQAAIVETATAFEERIAKRVADYFAALDSPARLVPTERILFQEII